LNRRLNFTIPLLVLPFIAFGKGSGSNEPACCGVAALATVVIIIYLAYRKDNKSADSGIDVPPLQMMPNGFQLGILPEKKDPGAGDMECLTVKIRGLIRLPQNMLTTSHSLCGMLLTVPTRTTERLSSAPSRNCR